MRFAVPEIFDGILNFVWNCIMAMPIMPFIALVDEFQYDARSRRNRLSLALQESRKRWLIYIAKPCQRENREERSLSEGVYPLDCFVDASLLWPCFSWHNQHNTEMHTIPPTERTIPIEEYEIRSALIALLGATHLGDSKVLEEFRIERGGARIDVLAIDKELVGYEIKSDRDTFARFSNQIHAYNRVFDRINLVCGPTLADHAVEVIPSWWGIVIASRDSIGNIHLAVRRVAGANPKQDAFSLASLLRKEEAIAVLSSAEGSAPKQASAHALWDCLARSLSVEAIRAVVAASLLKRQRYSELAVKTM